MYIDHHGSGRELGTTCAVVINTLLKDEPLHISQLRTFVSTMGRTRTVQPTVHTQQARAQTSNTACRRGRHTNVPPVEANPDP
eukprot:4778725-Lingulodinium_polyedra.AAC.1